MEGGCELAASAAEELVRDTLVIGPRKLCPSLLPGVKGLSRAY